MDIANMNTERAPSLAHVGMQEEEFIGAFKKAANDQPHCCCIFPLLSGSFFIIILLLSLNIALLIGSILQFFTNITIAVISTITISCLILSLYI